MAYHVIKKEKIHLLQNGENDIKYAHDNLLWNEGIEEITCENIKSPNELQDNVETTTTQTTQEQILVNNIQNEDYFFPVI